VVRCLPDGARDPTRRLGPWEESGIPIRLPPSITRDELELVTACNVCGSSRFQDVYPSAWVCRCQACGHVFRSPRPTVEAVSRFYSQEGKYAHWLDELDARVPCWRYRLKQLRRFVRSGRLLDVGAGVGEFLRQAAGSFEVVGTEVSDEAIRLARQRSGVELLKGTLAELPDLRARRFDVVSLVHVLEHVHDPGGTLAACAGLLRPGGWLFVAVPNDSATGWFKRYWGTARLLRRMARTRTPMVYDETPPFGSVRLGSAGVTTEIHLSHFAVASLRALLSRNGFETVCVGPDPCHASAGVARLRDDADLHAWRLFAASGGEHCYQTILAVARKSPAGPPAPDPPGAAGNAP
jgi:2-polyprenyl-3-methyl-5-hydroxy-6-metoxy-1,4-benzoquinol methylase